MKIAFLGTGRMGSELARYVIKSHDVTVWNRTAERAQPLVDEGATLADSPAAAVEGAEVIITSLFGPDDIREVVIGQDLIPAGITWIDTTTVSPEAAREFADAVESYVHAPVVGSLIPARNGELGVYVGTPDDARREVALDIARPWAGENKLIGVDSAAKAATGKLLANLALSVTAQGVLEALNLGESEGLAQEEVLKMLDITGLAFMKNMKAPFILGERDTAPGDFTVDALCKDSKLMVDTADQELPAVQAAIKNFERQQELGHGDEDFSSIFVYRKD
ncbi:MAG: NAD(P)-dependent oxidoreductase [Corynebacterium casei]|nr:NAD(P)-dependent oxidoreductase [Corynebacterium casei]MDN5799975.1 NAD(P)-dependent oxidoreductase [Corynebacterium casei]MDN5902726.1 NAD(P)-dependent oxidoreductase [Corynebacterium casei]MDN5922500.1 NAD(P)-dependent oxidoreductase [Corynebacterium casei]MDN6155080.1 NAD(P)-dependent oxidoreductase [Corynebacterium casei]MDN6246733.1 NAD(P)-dependent oxidoreductase [Corynebacterium casei]